MASGYGLNGGPSRCFPFWQELLACYVVNTNTEDVSGAKKCLPAMEDYYECLHHKKEVGNAHTQVPFSPSPILNRLTDTDASFPLYVGCKNAGAAARVSEGTSVTSEGRSSQGGDYTESGATGGRG
ncbi:hypothetical protein MMC20_003770 [Loxospora ochrophaea]|nr:hypothetical protein [Loxospora ochrophaea]